MNRKNRSKTAMTGFILIVWLIALIPVSSAEDDFHAVKGAIYIDGEVASPGKQIYLVFPEENISRETMSWDGQYNYVFSFTDHEGETGMFYVYHQGNFLIPDDNDSVAIVDGVIKYHIDLHVTSIPEEPGDDGNNDGPGSGSGETGEGENEKPHADASASDTAGFIGDELTFDGSLSTDDGDITNYTWFFDDGSMGYGMITSHAFSEAGTYDVILTVTDDDGETDDDIIVIEIAEGNHPPSLPSVNGTSSGKKNVVYEFSAVSTDPDDDLISYSFDWGDGDTTITELLPNGTMTIQNHSWGSAGQYILTVRAFDNTTYSETAYFTVFIDAQGVGDLGYLKDNDSDGVYDTFYNGTSGAESGVTHGGNYYFIDTNGDGIPDFIYDPLTKTLTQYSESETKPVTETIDPMLIGLVIVGIIAGVLVLMVLIRRGREKTS